MRHFFLRGLAIILPTVLTIWLLVIAYNFMHQNIATPINHAVRWAVVLATPYPQVLEEDIVAVEEELRQQRPAGWRQTIEDRQKLRRLARLDNLTKWWQQYAWGLDLIGLIVAVVLIYLAGGLLGSFIGRAVLHRFERFLDGLPLIRRVYPSFKQITDFIVSPEGGANKMRFNRVVAVQYPRKGLWSVGLVTGDTMRLIQDEAGEGCMTVFVPSSPTPFTGYVITVPTRDTIDLPITVEDALKFAVSGGVLVPPSQQLEQQRVPDEAEAQARDVAGDDDQKHDQVSKAQADRDGGDRDGGNRDAGDRNGGDRDGGDRDGGDRDGGDSDSASRPDDPVTQRSA